MSEELVGRSAIELSRSVRDGELDPVDLLTAHFDAIDERDGAVRSFQCFRRGAAFQEARELERRIRLEDPDLGPLPLAGVPVAVKDSVDVAGLPTRNGSLATSPEPAARDAEMVARLRAAGAVVIGKTRVPEFCLWAFTESLAYGATHNPWNLRRAPGGSSGGSAAAVAAGMVPIALGADGMGSIRIPSAACGLFGIKPGEGVVPKDSPFDWHGLSEWGPMATTVEDAAVMLSVLAARPELREPTEDPDVLRVAVSMKPAVPVPVDDQLTRAVERVASELRGAGHTVSAADPPIPNRAVMEITKRRLEGLVQEYEAAPGDSVEARTATELRIARTLRRASGVDPAAVRRFRAGVDRWFADHDVLLTPTIAKPIGAVGENHGHGYLATAFRQLPYSVFCSPWNLAGYPAASVPAGFDRDGMPVGVQLIAPRGSERLLLSVARQLEQRRPWPRHAPEEASLP